MPIYYLSIYKFFYNIKENRPPPVTACFARYRLRSL